LDLSSSSASESDTSNTNHYSSTVGQSGTTKLNPAQMRRQNREKKIMANRKMMYFIEKYGKISPGTSMFLIKIIFLY
jgi:hypothetical protein